MSVEGFGKQLLSEIEHEEGLDNVLKLLRNVIDPYTAHELGVPALDRICRVFENLHRQETSLSRQQGRDTALSITSKGSRARVIEISAATSCSGKTQLLYLAVASTLLPAGYESEFINRNAGAVIWLDTDGRFSILRLQQVILQHINQSYERAGHVPSPMQTESAQNLCKSSLQHLHVFRPQSFDSLISTIKSLPSYLFNPSLHHSSSRPLRLLVLSSLGAFLGSDRMGSDTKPTAPPEQPHNSHFIQQYTDLAAGLRDLQETLDCSIIATNWSLSPMQDTSYGPSARPHLPNVWNNLCMLKFLVKRDRVPKYEPGMSAQEAVHEGAMREETLNQSQFLCQINYWGSEEWPDSVLKGLQGLENGRCLSFEVDRGGVRVNAEDRE